MVNILNSAKCSKDKTVLFNIKAIKKISLGIVFCMICPFHIHI